MPATITATGTWTPLNVDFTNMDKTDANVPHSDKMQLEQLKAADLPELTQFIQAMADGYGIGFNAAKALLNVIWVACMNRETPSVSRVYAA
jgi:hypothetical protein